MGRKSLAAVIVVTLALAGSLASVLVPRGSPARRDAPAESTAPLPEGNSDGQVSEVSLTLPE